MKDAVLRCITDLGDVAHGVIGVVQVLKAAARPVGARAVDGVVESELHGEKLNPWRVGSTIALLLIAGIDTTWSGIGASMSRSSSETVLNL